MRDLKEDREDMNINSNYRIVKNIEVDVSDIDGEKVIMDLSKGQYFVMNEVGSRIWDILDETKTYDGIVGILLNEYNIKESICRNTVYSFINRLNKAELVKLA